MSEDYRDHVVRDLADQEYRLARQLAAYRQMLSVALGQLHERGNQLKRLRQQHRELQREYRRFRAAIRGDGRAA